VTTAPTRPADLARWAFWGPLRATLSADQPALVRALGPAWNLQWRLAGKNATLMEDEYRRWLGPNLSERGYKTLVRDTYRKGWRTHLEELLLSKLTSHNLSNWATIEHMDRLQAALDRGNGVILVYPHAGPVMLMIAALSLHGIPYVQYAARGLAPEAIAEAHPELLASNRWRQAVRTARESHEDALNVEYLTLDAPVRTLHRRLEDNKVIGIAFDGRIGSGWFPATFLNRTALLSRGPWKLATSTGAAVVPVFCHSPDGAAATVEVGEPVDPGTDWRALADTVLAIQESWLRKHPEEYGLWLLHTRQRAAIDDHPFFIDTATDERYRRWMD
jgi:lauroyl/myristoyl acyltransferase